MPGGTGRVTGIFRASDRSVLSGNITFTPSVTHLLINGVTVLPAPITCHLVDGVLSDLDGHPYVDLYASDAPRQNPLRFTYRADFHLTRLGQSVTYASFSFEVPGGLTTDLVTVARVPGNLSLGTAVGPEGKRGPTGRSGVVILQAGDPTPVAPESGVLYLRLIT